MSTEINFPEKPAGRPSQAYQDRLDRFTNQLREVDSRLDFSMSARGWAYFLENEGKIDKSDIDYAQGKMNELRKKGKLPLDFMAEDETRRFKCRESVPFDSPEDYLESNFNMILEVGGYDVSFWEQQDCFIQVLVEKVDLRELFEPICSKYNIPIATSKGWSSIMQRGKILSRFYEWEKKGNRPILLYCGDFDPAGVKISDKLRKNFADLEDALIPAGDKYIQGYTPSRIEINRFGLTYEQIRDANLTWIDNLKTGSGKNLASKSHSSHETYDVPQWLNQYGERKVEANALVTNPEYGRDIFRETVERYLGENPLGEYEEELESRKREVKTHLSERGLESDLEKVVNELEDDQ